MNLNSDCCMKFKFFKHGKAPNVTFLFVNNFYESLDTIWHPRWLPKKKDFVVFFSHTNISLRFL